MSWLMQLYKTYEANADQVGKKETKAGGQTFTLLPISHTTQMAQIEVTITEEGDFHSATVIEKDDKDQETIIPCNEKSASRASNLAPHPLHDKLCYVAGDYMKYGGEAKKEEAFNLYIQQLKEWTESPVCHPKVKSIYNYLRKRRLIRDLIEDKILFTDNQGILLKKWEEKDSPKPPIFKATPGSGGPIQAFVRFNVYSPSKELTNVWEDKEIYQSYINYYNTKLGEKDYCYVSGEELPITELHAKRIRHPADQAKLISANDTSGFTFRGRFHDGREAAAISYKVSQEAHNALKWLINRQGKSIHNRVFLVWTYDGKPIPDTLYDSYDIFSSSVQDETLKRTGFTNKEFAREVASALDGYKHSLTIGTMVNILVLDAATPGRMAVIYYRNIEKNEYFDRLKQWHSTCVWEHHYRKENGQFITFFGAPALIDISFAAYGPRANDQLVKVLMERMLPCIIDNKKIPLDIVRSAFHRACNPVSMEHWEWEKTLSITCALFNKQEGFDVALDTENKNRDYLFGRLLAIADFLERRALDPNENRESNAIRYMNAFSQHPERTWMTIQASIAPYQSKLGNKGRYYSMLIDDVASSIAYEDFNNKPLSGKFLLGFYSQRHDLYQKKETKGKEE